MIILDSLLAGGIRFVLDKIAAAVENEMYGEGAESSLREQLLAAEMQLELGEIDDEEFAALETEIVAHLQELRRGQREPGQPQGALSFDSGQVDVQVNVAGAQGEPGEP